MIKSHKQRKFANASSQGITPVNKLPPDPRHNKLSMQTINTVRTNQHKPDPSRLNTEPHKLQVTIPFQDEWEQIHNRRENFLNSMFNRRKTVLENISKKNRDIYIRITNQESHYNFSKPKENREEKNTVESLTVNSRLMLTLSKNALSITNANKLEPLREKELNVKTNEGEDRLDKKVMSKQLAPILECPQGSDFKIVQSRYLKDELLLSLNPSTKCIVGKQRGRSVGRARLADVYTNF